MQALSPLRILKYTALSERLSASASANAPSKLALFLQVFLLPPPVWQVCALNCRPTFTTITTGFVASRSFGALFSVMTSCHHTRTHAPPLWRSDPNSFLSQFIDYLFACIRLPRLSDSLDLSSSVNSGTIPSSIYLKHALRNELALERDLRTTMCESFEAWRGMRACLEANGH